MGKRLMLILACALLVGFLALPAFAEVQNIRVSGDITAMGLSRSGFHLGYNDSADAALRPDDTESHALSILRLKVDAELTEKVSATARLINERNWGEEDTDSTSNPNPPSPSRSAATVDSSNIDVDLAFITLREFLDSPLTLIIGRQELHFGNDFIIGDSDTNNQVSNSSALVDADLSKRKAFDAIRGTLNYDPLVVDLFWAKVRENTLLGNNASPEKDDIDLFGVNGRYDFGGKYKTIAELYWFGKIDNRSRDANAAVKSATKTNTIGGRVEVTPMERLNLQAELAFQSGRLNSANNTNVREHEAVAAQGIARYALNMKYRPVLMAIYSFYSGDKDGSGTNSDHNWDPMYENQTSGHIINVLFNASDAHILNLRGSLVPIEDLTVTLDYVWLALAKPLPAGTATMTTFLQNHASVTPNVRPGNNHLGDEIDLTLTYDYTEDVQLGLMAGVFMPGSAFRDRARDNNVSEVIASVKVAF